MTTFSPDLSCTRAQAVTFLWRAAGETGALRQYGLCRCPGGQLLCRGRCLGGGEQRYERHGQRLLQPDAPCTRAQIVTFLWRAAGEPESSGSTAFADVPAGSYYAAAVAWAAENNVTNGTGSGCFQPG